MPSDKDGVMIILSSPSGAGKTTLLQILGTLDSPDAKKDFSLSINGKSVKNLKDREISLFRNNHKGF